MVYHHLNKFGDHRHCDSVDIKFLIRHVMSHDKCFVN